MGDEFLEGDLQRLMIEGCDAVLAGLTPSQRERKVGDMRSSARAVLHALNIRIIATSAALERLRRAECLDEAIAAEEMERASNDRARAREQLRKSIRIDMKRLGGYSRFQNAQDRLILRTPMVEAGLQHGIWRGRPRVEACDAIVDEETLDLGSAGMGVFQQAAWKVVPSACEVIASGLDPMPPGLRSEGEVAPGEPLETMALRVLGEAGRVWDLLRDMLIRAAELDAEEAAVATDMQSEAAPLVARVKALVARPAEGRVDEEIGDTEGEEVIEVPGEDAARGELGVVIDRFLNMPVARARRVAADAVVDATSVGRPLEAAARTLRLRGEPPPLRAAVAHPPAEALVALGEIVTCVSIAEGRRTEEEEEGTRSGEADRALFHALQLQRQKLLEEGDCGLNPEELQERINKARWRRERRQSSAVAVEARAEAAAEAAQTLEGQVTHRRNRLRAIEQMEKNRNG